MTNHPDQPTAEIVAAPSGPAVLRSVGVEELMRAQEDITHVVTQALKHGTDYGAIPGAGERKVLLKPGAERLCMAFDLQPVYSILNSEVDHDRVNLYEKKEWYGPRGNRSCKIVPGESKGMYRYVVNCDLVQRHTGKTVGSCQGIASTLESKYIDRPRDTENTILKMAQKRALVGAVLNVFGLSDRFTEEYDDPKHDEAAGTETTEETGGKQADKKAEARKVQPYAAFMSSVGATPGHRAKLEEYAKSNGLKLPEIVAQYQLTEPPQTFDGLTAYVQNMVKAAKAEASMRAQAPIAQPDGGTPAESPPIEAEFSDVAGEDGGTEV